MTQRVELLAPAQWLMKAANAGARNPKVLLLGAFSVVAVSLGALFAAAVAVGALMGQQNAGTPENIDTATLLKATWPLMLLAMIAPQVVIGGLAQLVHRVETDGHAQVRDAFSGFRREHLPSLCGLAVIPLASLALTLVMYRFFGGEGYAENYMAAVQQMAAGQMAAPPQPSHPLALMFGAMLLNWVTYAIQLFAPIHVVLGGRGTFAAIGDCLRGFARNLPAMLVGGLLGFFTFFAIFMLMAVALLLGAVLTKFIPVVGSMLAFAMLLGLAVVGVLFWVSCGYFGWRALFGGKADNGRVENDRIEI